ncbi:hypothetical protein PoB_006577600 [Plakobranchus ocellatus]|uniref:Uncharacterized protein n=1 Tax=Plakobranchus ocellatus TaxID=259542 RepID=A0AAV4D5N5_9GAST|nr:hypothetical protein PoB_006577600 [Plakobranchus ocellatus]
MIPQTFQGPPKLNKLMVTNISHLQYFGTPNFYHKNPAWPKDLERTADKVHDDDDDDDDDDNDDGDDDLFQTSEFSMIETNMLPAEFCRNTWLESK